VSFLRTGVIAACLKEEGKEPSRNERFASSAINSAKTAAHDLTKDGGKSRFYVFMFICHQYRHVFKLGVSKIMFKRTSNATE